ncbi:hypothetical protein I5P86_11785 [Pseudomonas glycinae]|uniref:hypothetical protein n=1 Tax=Pseudomonas glycinae TaxID=1785145 RepID=UPI0018D5B634|nr:hypothetical protein [Pseudomonas glycinae]MBH3405733.1 hypothetical protein [Pseudomonas glycinae]
MMRNIQTREGYEFWDKICKVQSYAFLLSPDGRRVVKTPDVGDWIDKHEAQVIVDHAQEEFNVMKAERDALQERLNAADQRIDEYCGMMRRLVRNVDHACFCAEDLEQQDDQFNAIVKSMRKAVALLNTPL